MKNSAKRFLVFSSLLVCLAVFAGGEYEVIKKNGADRVFLAVHNLSNTYLYCYIDSAEYFVDFSLRPDATSRYYPEPYSEYFIGCE